MKKEDKGKIMSYPKKKNNYYKKSTYEMIIFSYFAIFILGIIIGSLINLSYINRLEKEINYQSGIIQELNKE